MPDELEETAVDVGDSEETSTDIDVIPRETEEDQEADIREIQEIETTERNTKIKLAGALTHDKELLLEKSLIHNRKITKGIPLGIIT